MADEQPAGGSDDLTQSLTQVAGETARELVARGNFSEACTAGTTLIARAGRHRFSVKNAVTRAPPGNRDQMCTLYASMVVRNLLGRVKAKSQQGSG